MQLRAMAATITGLSLIGAAGCASNWPSDSYLEPEQDIPPPYSDPARPRFEFEPDPTPAAGPAFREETAAARQERVTAERLADVQRAGSARYAEETASVSQYDRRYRTYESEAPVELIETVPMNSSRMETVQLTSEPAPAYSPTPVQGAVSTIPPMPAARPGECYAMVRRPEQYRTVQKRIVKRPAHERIEVVPARYARGTETVTVQEGYERLEIVPATFKTVTERVLVREASSRWVTTEPRYKTVQERVLVRPARSVWKPGRGPIERIDNATGEIMCLVEEPAIYKTVTRRELVQAPDAREVQVPAQYRTVTRRVIDQPAQVRRVRVPAPARCVPVERVSQPSVVRRVRVPAEYETVAVRELAAPAQLEWRSILCETNMTRDNIRAVQQALKARGFDPGPIDGVIGGLTMAAVNRYQRANDLPVDRYLNIETIRHLGVRLR